MGLARGNPWKDRDSGLVSVPFFLWFLRRRGHISGELFRGFRPGGPRDCSRWPAGTQNMIPKYFGKLDPGIRQSTAHSYYRDDLNPETTLLGNHRMWSLVRQSFCLCVIVGMHYSNPVLALFASNLTLVLHVFELPFLVVWGLRCSFKLKLCSYLGTVQESPTRTTCLKCTGSTPPICTAVRPSFVTLFLAGFQALKKGKRHNTPPICTTIRLLFVPQYASYLYRSTPPISTRSTFERRYWGWGFQKVSLLSVYLKSEFASEFGTAGAERNSNIGP